MQETWVQSFGGVDPLEKGMATHSSILPGEFYRQRSLAGYSLWGHKESDTTEQLHLLTYLLQEDPWEEEIATHSSIWPGESHGQSSLAGYSPKGCKELDND